MAERKLSGNPGNLNIPELFLPENTFNYSIAAAATDVVTVPSGATKALLVTNGDIWIDRNTVTPAAPPLPEEVGDGNVLIPAGSMVMLRVGGAKSFAIVGIAATSLISISWF